MYSQLCCQRLRSSLARKTRVSGSCLLQMSPATVAFRVFRAAVPLIKRYLRVLANEPFSRLLAVLEVRDDQLVGRFALLLPLFDQAERVEVDVLDSGRPRAVAHS